jgi:glucose-6-phosphate 1-dehydrogenase
MEPPAGADSESVRDEKAKVLKCVRPLDPDHLVRGQFRGYRNEAGVAAESDMETFAALRLEINSWRWKGVPFFLRAGKSMPVTCTEVLVRFRQPPAIYSENPLPANHFRFRISPDVVIALGTQVLDVGDSMSGRSTELTVTDDPNVDAMDAYERLLHDAMLGDATLFAREDSVEQAWRIVEPVLTHERPVREYAPNTWGPRESDQITAGCGAWHNPVVAVKAAS